MALIDILVYTIVIALVGFCVITIITTIGDNDE